SLLCTPALGLAGDWNQWRGPQRTGAMVENRSYLDRLPAAGLKPLWITTTDLPSAGSSATARCPARHRQSPKVACICDSRMDWSATI
ncbi:MAG: hypothetical protein VB862_20325, partial [Pirellulaceae bacterium]